MSQTISSLSKENERLVRELEYQGENGDLLLRENSRLNKVVQSLQVECSLQKASIEELSRKCKIKDKIIQSLRQDDGSGMTGTGTFGEGTMMGTGMGMGTGRGETNGKGRRMSETKKKKEQDFSTPASSATTQFMPDSGYTAEV